MSKFVAGQAVVVTQAYFPGPVQNTRTTVTRVGRKYAYATVLGREASFDIETGYNKLGELPSRMWTLDEYDEHVRHNEAVRGLYEVGLRVVPGSRHSADTLERIRALIVSGLDEADPGGS